MEQRDRFDKIVTGGLALCAVLVTVLVSVTVLRPDASRAAGPDAARGSGAVAHRLPSIAPPGRRGPDGRVVADFPDTTRAIPLVPEWASIVPLGTNSVIFLPVVMDEPRLPDGLYTGLVDPKEWSRSQPAPLMEDVMVGRPSVWWMDVGAEILYGVMIDPRYRPPDVGVAFVTVKRLGETTYDVVARDDRGNVLFAARGNKETKDRTIGRATLKPVPDQRAVRERYGPRWTPDPISLPLFSSSARSGEEARK